MRLPVDEDVGAPGRGVLDLGHDPVRLGVGGPTLHVLGDLHELIDVVKPGDGLAFARHATGVLGTELTL